MGLGHLPPQTRHNDRGCAEVFNNTWGHFAPQKNVSYKGLVRFTITYHGEYGRQPIITQYEFPNLTGPYIHDALFKNVCEWGNVKLEEGAIYERTLTFRNYRFYLGKITLVLNPFKI